MRTLIKLAPVVGIVALLAACGTTMEQRAATGALGGAVVGQAIGHNTTSTVLGGVAGATVGAATTHH